MKEQVEQAEVFVPLGVDGEITKRFPVRGE